jgi:hypothetical protein
VCCVDRSDRAAKPLERFIASRYLPSTLISVAQADKYAGGFHDEGETVEMSVCGR